MACFCFGRTSFESALRKGDVVAALSHLEEDPLTAARRHFQSGNTLWHIAATSGHLPLLQALAARLTAVWPTPEPDPHQHQQQRQPHHHPGTFLRRSNPFQRFSDGLRGIGPDPSRLPLAAFINTPNLLGQTALMAACNQGHPGCVKFLLDLGANAWYRDRANCTALHYATLHDQGDCIEALLQHPASARPPPGTRQSLVRLVDLPNFCGYTAAHFAAAANKPRALAALLAGGANIGARCWTEGSDWISGAPGSTPLHLAARRGDMQLCRMMMSHYLEVLRDSGAPDPRLPIDARGFRPYQRAAERNYKELAEMLTPSTPLSYIFSTDVVRLYKVPKLKALASAALQEALLSQINEMEVAATERLRLATQVAVAAARAAAGGGGGAGGGAGAGAFAVGVDPAGDTAVAAGPARTSRSGAVPFSRKPSLINSALQFVRQTSLRPLASLRRRLHSSGRWQLGGEPSRELTNLSHNSNSRTPSDVDTTTVRCISGYGGGTTGSQTGRTVSGVNCNVPGGTPRPSGISTMPAAASLSTISAVSAAAAAALPPAAEPTVQYGAKAEAAAAALATGVAPLLVVGCERSAPVGGEAAAKRPLTATATSDHRAWVSGSGAAAVGAPAGASPTATPPGGASPVRGSSFDSDQLPFLPSTSSPLYSGMGAAAAGHCGGGLELPPAALGNTVTNGVPVDCTGSCTDGHDPSVSSWAARMAAVVTVGSLPATAADTTSTWSGVKGRRGSYSPAAMPSRPPPLTSPPSQPTIASPFALPALQTQALVRHSGTPAGGSPTYNSDGAAARTAASLGYGPYTGGSSLPPPPPPPTLPPDVIHRGGLLPVSETTAVGEDDGGGAAAATDRTIEQVSKRASKYVLSQPPPGQVRTCSGPPTGSNFASSYGSGVAGGSPTPGSPRLAQYNMSAAAAVIAGRASAEFVYGSAGIGSTDPAGGSPPLGTFALPGTASWGPSGHNIGGVRAVSGPLQTSGGSGTMGQGAGAALTQAAGEGDCGGGGAGGRAGTIGSDTSGDYCGVCFERPALLHIRPCQHTLCAECSREVTRMVETLPPSCPFCRGIVRGFGC